MNVLDLFSGIGSFSLGLERAGMKTVAFCECDPFARRVLQKHWPDVEVFEDVRTLTRARLDAIGLRIDLVCGGFPCQPHSVAGKRGGSADERDLWPEFARIIREVRPRWILAENVPGILSNESGRFFGGILRDLAESGYDAEWDCYPASAIGAPHRRDRVWLVGYPHGGEPLTRSGDDGEVSGVPEQIRPHLGAAVSGGTGPAVADPDGGQFQARQRLQRSVHGGSGGVEPDRSQGAAVADPDSGGRREQGDVGQAHGGTRAGQSGNGGAAVADAHGLGAERLEHGAREAGPAERDLSGRCGAIVEHPHHAGRGEPAEGDAGSGQLCGRQPDHRAVGGAGGAVPLAGQPRLAIGPGTLAEWAHATTAGGGIWAVEPDVGRVVAGPAVRVDRRVRLIALGNSLVPQLAEMIGRAILDAS